MTEPKTARDLIDTIHHLFRQNYTDGGVAVLLDNWAQAHRDQARAEGIEQGRREALATAGAACRELIEEMGCAPREEILIAIENFEDTHFPERDNATRATVDEPTKEVTVQEAIREMSTEDLEQLSKDASGVSPHTHSVGSCLSALGGIDVDIELSRRRLEEAKHKTGEKA